MSCGGRCGSCGSVDTGELRNLVSPFLPDVRVPSEPFRPPSTAAPTSTRIPSAPRPVLTPARHTVAVPVRAPAP